MPLAQRQALGIAVMSYDGHLGFGLLGDYDALPDLEEIALDLKWAVAALCRAAGVRTRCRAQAARARRRTAPRPAGSAPRQQEARERRLDASPQRARTAPTRARAEY